VRRFFRLGGSQIDMSGRIDDSAVSVIVAVNDRGVLENNLLRSPELAAKSSRHQVLVREGYDSASHAYNSAIEEARHDLMLFVHQDVYLPDGWFESLHRWIRHLDEHASNWGVLGAYGAVSAPEIGVGRIYTNGLGYHGAEIREPQPVETLDEITLVFRKSSGLRFDPHLPYFHMYGTDICLSARMRSLSNYAIPALCVHNTNQLVVLPREFYAGYDYVKRKWRSFLPIQTSCIRISRYDLEKRCRQLRESLNCVAPMARARALRLDDPTVVLAQSL
jgi:Glycosyltransferase like family